MRLPRDRHGPGLSRAARGRRAAPRRACSWRSSCPRRQGEEAKPRRPRRRRPLDDDGAGHTAPAPPPATTTAPPPPPAGPLQAVAVGPFSATVEWTRASPPARVGYGLADLGPTMWAPVKGRRATITGLHYSTPYRVWAGDATFDFTTAGPPDSPAASIGGGAILLDGQPYFPLIVLALCPVSYPNALAAGITLYAENACGGIAEQTAGLAGKAFSLTKAERGRGDRARRDRLVLPGRGRPEGDHRRDASRVPAAGDEPRLRVLTLTNHFYSRTATLPGGRGNLPGTDREIGRRRVRPVPAAGVLQRRVAPRRRLRAARARRPGAGAPDIPVDRGAELEVPAARHCASRRDRACGELAVGRRRRHAGSASSRASGIRRCYPRCEQISKEVAAIGGGLLAPDSPASATGAGHRQRAELRRRALRDRGQPDAHGHSLDDHRRRPGGPGGRRAGGGEKRRRRRATRFTDSFAPLGVHLYVVTPS